MGYIVQSLLSFAALFVAFLGGWFIAADKNRNDLFKARLVAFQEIQAVFADVFALSIKAQVNKEIETEYISARLVAYEVVMKHGLLLPVGFTELVVSFMAQESTEERNKVFNKVIDTLKENLSIPQMELITNLLYIKYELLLKQLKGRTKQE